MIRINIIDKDYETSMNLFEDEVIKKEMIRRTRQ
jgi:hypothetical protein